MTDAIPGAVDPLENRLNPFFEARLTNIVNQLRTDWINRMAPHWTAVHTVNENASGQFEERISAAFRDGFFKFGQFLCGFEMLLLQSKQLGVVSEERILSIEQVLVQVGPRNSYFVEVPDPDS